MYICYGEYVYNRIPCILQCTLYTMYSFYTCIPVQFAVQNGNVCRFLHDWRFACAYISTYYLHGHVPQECLNCCTTGARIIAVHRVPIGKTAY